jgi:carboxyl-terminal processing protease
VENRAFQSWLQWEYEWIWAYVDMPEPWVVVVVSPIAGWPAEKSGLKWWDIIYSVDWIDVWKKESLTQITTRIKWPAGTAVRLWVIRKSKKMDFVVIRDKIVLNDVTWKKLNSSTYYLQIRMFSGSIAKQFKKELEFLNTQNWIKKIVIDLRNNPGGFLDQAVDILWHFIEEGKPVAVVKYKESEQSYTSFGYNTYDFDGKKIIVLINWGTASASEILTWTLKDYYPNDVAIIWEKSFWKWSVQTQRYYKDGSALKYTIAKWYTGKTEKWIDKIGIQPDKEINYDEELFRKKRSNKI